MEVWKDIKNYEGIYQISNFGNIKSLDRITFNGRRHTYSQGKFLKLSKTANGYIKIMLRKNNKSITELVHRLVAESFLSNNDNKQLVNHIDKNKSNNTLHNLEWSTYSENQRHSISLMSKEDVERFSKCNVGKIAPNARLVLDTQTGIFYNSVREASDIFKLNERTLAMKLIGRMKNNTSLVYC